MFTRRFRGNVNVPADTGAHRAIPDLVRNQVFQVGNHSPCTSIAFQVSSYYQINVFDDTTLPTDATLLLLPPDADCSDLASINRWDNNVSVDSNLVVDDADFVTIWFLTSGIKGFYNSGSLPEGERQNLRVVRTFDVTTDDLAGETVMDSVPYGSGSWHVAGAVTTNFNFLISAPGLDHAFMFLSGSLEVAPQFDVDGGGGGPNVKVYKPAKIIKVDTSAALGTEVDWGNQDTFQCACIDPLTGDLWVSKHTTNTATSAITGSVILHYDEDLNFQSSTTLTAANYITCMTFSNFGDVPIIYCHQQNGGATTLRRFDPDTLTFLSTVTLTSAGSTTIYPIHGGLFVDDVAGYLYRASAASSTNAISVYRMTGGTVSVTPPTTFTRLGLCESAGWGMGATQGGPTLTSDGGKLYAYKNTATTGTGAWIAPYYDLIGEYPTAFHGEIVSIEEDWEYEINIPTPDEGDPTIRQRTIVTTACGTNHRATVRIGPLGASMELFTNPSTFSTQNTTSQDQPTIIGEDMSWTVRMALSGGVLTVSLPAASSTTVPDLDDLTRNVTPSLNYIGDYKPEWSIGGQGAAEYNGSEFFFNRCATGVAAFRRTGYRIELVDAVGDPLVTIDETITDDIPEIWPACTALDIDFTANYFTGMSVTGMFIHQTADIGYFVSQNTPNLLTEVDLINRVVTDTLVTTTRIMPYDNMFGGYDQTNEILYFPAVEQDTQSATLTHNALTFSGANVGYTIQRSGGSSFLYTIDPTDGDTVLMGDTGIENMAGLAFDTDGTTLYAITGAGASASTLYTLNPATGAVLTTVGATGHDEMVSIAIRKSDGQMYTWKNGASPGLYSVNKLTAVVAAIGGSSIQMSSMTFHPSTHVLYGTHANALDLVSINVSDGSLTSVADLPNAGALAIGWDNDAPTLWLKWDTTPSFINEVDVPGGEVLYAAGPLPVKIDTSALTYVLGEPFPGFDAAWVSTFDFANDYGYFATGNSSGNEKVYKYDLSTMTLFDTLDLGEPEGVTAITIDRQHGNIYLVQSNSGFNQLLVKIDIGTFTVTSSVELEFDEEFDPIRTLTFMNGFIYAVNEFGFMWKVGEDMSVDGTLRIPLSPHQIAYPENFTLQIQRVNGQSFAIDPVNNFLYLGTNSPGYAMVYKIDANSLTILGSLPLNSFYHGFQNIRSVALDYGLAGYAMPYNGTFGEVIEFEFNFNEPIPFGFMGNTHQRHDTGTTTDSIPHDYPLNEWTTTKGIGMRRKWILAGALAGGDTPAPTPAAVVYSTIRTCSC